MRAISASSASLRKSAAVGPDFSMRMSSGPSAEKEKPRSALSSCIEETPISSVMASTSPMPRSTSTRSIWLNRSSTSVSRGSGTSDRACFDRIGVAIEGDHSSRPHPKQRGRIAACPKRSIDRGLALMDGHRGHNLFEKHRHVRRIVCAAAGHAFSPFSSSRKRAMSFMSSGTRGSLRNSFGFQTWNVSPAPRNSASSWISPLRRIIGGRTMRPDGS